MRKTDEWIGADDDAALPGYGMTAHYAISGFARENNISLSDEGK